MNISGGKSVKKGQKMLKEAKNFIKNPDISPICGFFQHFLALFDTFTTRHIHSYIKFEFSGYFHPYKHFLKKTFWKMN